MTEHVCAECDLLITAEPHTRADGEDVHPACCAECAEPPPYDRGSQES